MGESFHLVVIHGITDGTWSLQEFSQVGSFFSTAFPAANIIEFPFPNTSPSQPLASSDLHHQAQSVGRKLVGKSNPDDSESEYSSQLKDVPLIFIGHDIGGCLIKQVLLLASEETVFQPILPRVKGVIFVGTPHKGSDLTVWEHHVICLLASSRRPLPFPSQYLQGLPQQLSENAESFAAISWDFKILNVLQARRGLDDILGFGTRYEITLHDTFTRLDLPNVIPLSIRSSYAELWQFKTGNLKSETVCANLTDMLKDAKSASQDGFQTFIQHISQLHSDPYGIGPTQPAANSLEWIDHDDTYKRWKSKNYRGLLHVSGSPGSGTTVLATNLLRLALEDRSYRQTTMLSFHFNKYDIRARSQKSALLSLSRQLLLARPDLFRFVEPLCNFMLQQKLFNKGIMWSLIQSLLVHSTESTIYCALYGIHECEEREEITELINRLSDIVVQSKGSVNVIMTSDDKFASEHSKLCLCASDICMSIASGGQRHTTLAIRALVQENVARVARQKPLWAEFERDIIKVLCDEKSPSYLSVMHKLAVLESSDIRSTKDDFRKRLQQLRDEGVPTIPSTGYLGEDAWVISALSWISCSVRPLTVPELSMAIAFDEFRRHRSFHDVNSLTDIKLPQDFSALLDIVPRDIVGDLGRRVGPLIRVDKNRVLLTHRSFREVLKDVCLNFLGLFRACLEYLKCLSARATVDAHDMQQHEQEDALLDYAVAYWPEHYKLASRNSDAEADTYLNIFLGDGECLSYWYDHYRQMYVEDLLSTSCNYVPTRIHIACRFGLAKLVKASQLDSFDTGTLQVALDLASGSGHLELVSMLLNYGVKSPTALTLAARGGYSAIVSILTDSSEPTTWKDEDGRTVLHHAVLGGDYLTVLNLSRRTDIGLDTQSTDGSTPLSLAARTGQTPLVRVLIDAGAKMSLKDKKGMDPLKLAASAGFTEIVHILLEKNVNLLDAAQDTDTALHLATQFCHPLTVRRILEANPPLDHVNDRGCTPLHIAVEEGEQEILEMLLSAKQVENGKTSRHIDTDEGGAAERSLLYLKIEPPIPPLQLAAMSGRTNIVKALLYHGTHRLEECCRALYVAAKTGLKDVTKTLLFHGTPIDFRDELDSTVFHQAVVGRNVGVLEQLLAQSSEMTTVNTHDRDGMTALHEAARKGSLEMVQLLLQNEAAADPCTESGEETPLHFAAHAGHFQVARALVEKMTDIEKRNSEGKTAFELAVEGKHINIVKDILHSKKGVPFPFFLKAVLGQELVLKALLDDKDEFNWDCSKPNTEDERKTPLHLAVEWKFISAIELLQQHGADLNAKNDNKQTPLLIAVSAFECSTKIVELLLKKGADIDIPDRLGRTPLYVASLYGDLETVKILLENEPKPDVNLETTRGWVGLHAAADKDAEITRLLLDAGADPLHITKASGTIAFARACFSDERIEVVRRYLERPDCAVLPNLPDKSGQTAVHRSAIGGSKRIMEILIQHGADINAKDKKGTTPLHNAILEGEEDVADLLLDQSVDLSARSDSNGTFLMTTATSGLTKIADRLLAKQVDINETSKPWHTALHAAVRNDHMAMVEWLLRKGANANLANESEGSPLRCALISKNGDNTIEIARKLIVDGNADVNYVHADGISILRLAVSEGLTKIVELLLEHSASTSGEVPANEHPILQVTARGELSMFRALMRDKEAPLVRDRFGRGVLAVAIIALRDDVAELLLADFANVVEIEVNSGDHAGRTPLMLCMLKRRPEPKMDRILKKLLEKTAGIDAQDSEGKTALIYACTLGIIPWVEWLLEAGASPSVRDCRGRSALYWSCRRFAPPKIARDVVKHLRDKDSSGYMTECAMAVSAAVASHRSSLLEILLENNLHIVPEHYSDGWMPAYTAERYGLGAIEALSNQGGVLGESLSKEIGLRSPTPDRAASSETSKPAFLGGVPRLPSAWSQEDKTPCLIVGPETVIVVGDGPLTPGDEWGLQTVASIRANFPMVPIRELDNIYYFEVTIERQSMLEGSEPNDEGPMGSHWGVGFCEEYSRLNAAVGWEEGSYGWHGDDGSIFRGNVSRSLGDDYKYGRGSTIGCGIDFDHESAFFTRDGQIIGQFFTKICGKLYPAVSVFQFMKKEKISATFWTEGGENRFKFRNFKNPKIRQPLPQDKDTGKAQSPDSGAEPESSDDDSMIELFIEPDAA